MLDIKFTYKESQDVLYCLREMINNSCSTNQTKEYQEAMDRIKKAIKKKGLIKYHEEGREEEMSNIVEFRLADMVEAIRA
ncbi:MAG: hypothetical protein PHV11_04550 [Candidatus Bipolaricaulis sp.]|nr:hypothetical protein [Candidatus Bipolaricaulis sp.]